MAFHETTPPTVSEIITPGEEHITVPPLALFQKELGFWRSKFQEADKAGDVVGRRMAELFSGELRDQAIGRMAVEYMTAGVIPMERAAAGPWYATSTSLMALACLWRELSTNGLAFSFSEAETCFDFHEAEPHKSGMHFTEEHLRKRSGIAWPEAADSLDWYKGESIYVEVRRPAQPTSALVASYADFYGKLFRAS